MSEASTFDRALYIAQRRFGPVVEYVERTFVEPKLRDLLEQLAAGEEEAGKAQVRLLELRDAGLDRPADYREFNKIRADLFGAQTQVYAAVVAIVRPLLPSLLPSIPFPRMMPEVRPGQSRSLGELTTAATIGIAIIVALAAVAIAYILGEVVINVSQELAGVFIARARAEQFRVLADARLAAYRDCASRGGSAEECSAAAAEAVPTPRESGTETPMPGALDPTPWVLLGVGGTVLVLVAGAAFWFYRKASRVLPAGTGRVPVRNVAALPQRAPDLDGSKSSYNLEISGPAGIGRPRRKRGR